MRLCFISDASTIHTQRWVQYFIDRGHEVHLISTEPTEKEDIGGAELYVTKKLPFKLGIVSTVFNLALGVIQVRMFVRKINPGVLHARYATDCGVWAALSGFHPYIIRPMGSDIFIDAKRNSLMKAMIKYALKKADLIICNSSAMKEGVRELGVDERKITIIYDGVDSRIFSSQKRDEGLKNSLGIPGAPIVISIRPLEPIYDVETFIRAIPTVLKEIPEARFIIGGEGDQQKYLDLASSLGVSDFIRFTGWIRHDDLPRYLASSDVYVSTSLSDGNSICLQEAMASELAPVVTDIPANHEYLTNDENAFFIPAGDDKKLAEKIVNLLKDKAKRDLFGKACRQVIMERAERSTEMGKMEHTYQALSGK